MDLGLRERVVLVTGASGGIGHAMAEAFLAEGATVVVQGHTRFEGLAERLPGAVALRADLGDPWSVDALFNEIEQRFGRLDVLAANAGRWPQPELRLHETPVQDLQATLVDNLSTAMWTTRAFMGLLARTGPRDGEGVSIVLTGSTAGRFGEARHAAYAAAKAGLVGLARTLKNELVTLDPWGRINVVEPGWTATDRVKEGLVARPEGAVRATQTMALRQLARCEDIARTAVFLSSPTAARHITGEVLTVAGGMEGRRLWDAEQVDTDLLRARLDPDA
ncbi:MAG: SDR family oxidoreductase [Deltaproteobacteria bacterium]|nr:MAG: SDR family oxidoreductase [Deltaproteobacteria bacterium]